ncbi:MAG: hypothetical protein WCE61_09060 [Candidatus Acidiferrum sp.]
MSHAISLRLALAVLIAGIALPLAVVAHPQDSQAQSVAEAARRARERKKAYPKPARVITTDDLKPAPAQSSEAPAAPASQPAANSSSAPAADNASAPAAAAASTPASAEDATKKKEENAELAALKKQLAEAQKDLDLQQRELALDQDTVYSNPNYTDNPSGKAKLDNVKQQIAVKQQAVDALKARVAALESSLGTSAPATPAVPPSPPQL